MDIARYGKSKYKADIKSVVLTCESLRKQEKPIDVDLQEFIQKKWGISMDTLYLDLGIDPSIDTLENIFTLPDESVRFLVPEIIRDALRLGLRKAPIWKNLIAAEQTVKNPAITIPHINMSEATPRKVGEAETISTGMISFGQKTLKLTKIGRGIKIPYEVRNYVSINVVSIFLQDFGVKLGHGIDALMIDVLLNGEQGDGSESAPVVGILTPTTLVFADLLKVWVRLARLGRAPDSIIAGEDMALTTLNLTEFKTNSLGGTSPSGVPSATNMQLQTPIPNTTKYYIHGSMPADQQMIVDSSAAIIKYNSQPLLVESEKIVSNQTEATYATLTTGFGIVFRDARVVVDETLDISSNGFPDYMDVDALEQVTFE